MGEETERAEAVVERHDDNAATDERMGAVQTARRGAVAERSPMDKDHHRRRKGNARRREDVEDEAVLALLEGIAGDIGAERGRHLGGDRSELGGVAHAGPGLSRYRAAEPQVASGRRGVRDAEELKDAVVLASS